MLAPLVRRLGRRVPGLPVADTVKRVDGDGVVETLRARRPRGGADAAGLPRRRAAPAVAGESRPRRDCASLVEAQGGRVKAVEGDPRLLKVTDAEDLELVESWLA